jgi:hypothetical protein
MASIPLHCAYNRSADLLEDRSTEYLIESQASTQIRLKEMDTIAPKFTKVFSDQDTQATVNRET